LDKGNEENKDVSQKGDKKSVQFSEKGDSDANNTKLLGKSAAMVTPKFLEEHEQFPSIIELLV